MTPQLQQGGVCAGSAGGARIQGNQGHCIAYKGPVRPKLEEERK